VKVYLKMQGLDPAEHEVTSELVRLPLPAFIF
jgi:hypothetical protein